MGFPKDIISKVNSIEQLEIELAYFKATAQFFSHYVTDIKVFHTIVLGDLTEI